jgi:shikimate dehydrogenase
LVVEIISKTVRVGLIGAGIQGSLSPAMHMREGAEQGFDYRYDLFDLEVLGGGVAALGKLLDDAESAGYVGLNITYPCKQAVIEFLSDLSSDARALGAVNTVVFRGGRRAGHNTDWSGFSESFRRGLPGAKHDTVLVLGAGGAGAAVAHAMARLGTRRLVIVDTVKARADALAAQIAVNFPGVSADAVDSLASDEVRRADGVVHATPTGMAKHPGLPLPEALMLPHLWVADIVYFPLETELVRTARRHGLRVLDGGGMAVFQAAAAFELFTRRRPDSGRMLHHFAALTAAA